MTNADQRLIPAPNEKPNPWQKFNNWRHRADRRVADSIHAGREVVESALPAIGNPAADALMGFYHLPEGLELTSPETILLKAEMALRLTHHLPRHAQSVLERLTGQNTPARRVARNATGTFQHIGERLAERIDPDLLDILVQQGKMTPDEAAGLQGKRHRFISFAEDFLTLVGDDAQGVLDGQTPQDHFGAVNQLIAEYQSIIHPETPPQS